MKKTVIIIGSIAVVGTGLYSFYRKTSVPKLSNLRANDTTGIVMVDVDGKTVTLKTPYNTAAMVGNGFSVELIQDANNKVTGTQVKKDGSIRDTLYLQ